MKKARTPLRRAMATVLAAMSCNAFGASGSATLQTFDPQGEAVTVNIQTLDAQHLRLSSPQHPEAYLLMLGDRIYNVLQFGSLPIVMDAADMVSKLNAGGAALPATPAPNDDIRELVALDATGQKETVAGITGDRMRLRFVDSNKQARVEELVVVHDALLHDLSLALYRLGAVMGAAAGVATPAGSDRLAHELDAKGLGLLRMGTRLRLLSVDRHVPARDGFDLPAEPMSELPDLQLQ